MAGQTQQRRALVIGHGGRVEAVVAFQRTCELLIAAGIVPMVPTTEDEFKHDALPPIPGAQLLPEHPSATDLAGTEIAIVLGGDGTILRAAELVRGTQIPLVGVNLGHVGFLAESERADLDEVVARVVAKEYQIEERLALDVDVYDGETKVWQSWALNEAAVEKAARERMLWATMEINGWPLSSFGCDGVVFATPTGSTAYNFSAGGPVVWPNVEALIYVPLSAHTLFAKPLVVSPASVLAVELDQRTTSGNGVLWCDGRRSVLLDPGARVEVRRSQTPVYLARLKRGSFADRLTKKFKLPVDGWRGPSDRALWNTEDA